MARSRTVEDLTVDELRQLLIEKRRAERHTRLETYRRTGRVIGVEAQAVTPRLDGLRSEPLSVDEDSRPMAPAAPRRRFVDRMLLVVEVAAVIGLVAVVVIGISLLQNMNTEMASALAQPTMTPTPLIKAVVLPGGHSFAENGEAVFNKNEIPAHLLPVVESVADLPEPTPSAEQIVSIRIPAIGVDHKVVQGDTWEQLKKGVGQHIGSPDPGEQGNLILSAHNDIFGEIFRDLDQLKEGDPVMLYTQQHEYVYIIRQTRIVEPTAVEVMEQSSGKITTLISCYPYRVDDKRIVVTAEFSEKR